MTDGIIKGTGNSRYLKSVSNFLSLYPDYESFAAALIAGTLPIDLNGINTAGWNEVGTPLNKETLLTDDTADLMGLSIMTPEEAFKWQIMQGTRLMKWDGNALDGSKVSVSRSKTVTLNALQEIMAIDTHHAGTISISITRAAAASGDSSTSNIMIEVDGNIVVTRAISNSTAQAVQTINNIAVTKYSSVVVLYEKTISYDHNLTCEVSSYIVQDPAYYFTDDTEE